MTSGARPIVVVVGGRGALANAVRARLEATHDLRSVQRGDDVAEAMEGAHAVVVLVAAQPQLSGGVVRTYEKAAAAVAHGLACASSQTVVAVTTVPAYHRRREEVLAAYRRAQDVLSHSGAELVVLRSCGVIGSPETPTRTDRFLTAGRRSRVSLPGDGSHAWAPLTVEDAAHVIAAAVTAPPAAGTYALRGPQRRVVAISRAMNDGSVRFVERGPRAWRWRWGRRYVPSRSLTLGGHPSAAGVLSIPVSAATAAWSPAAVRRRRALAASRTRAAAFRNEGVSARTVSGLGTVFLLVAGLCLVLFGLFDLLLGPELAVRLIAAWLIVAGGLAVAGGGMLATTLRHRFAVAFLGAVAVAASALLFVLAWLVSGGGYAGAMVVALALGAVAAIVAALLWARGGTAVTAVLRRAAPALISLGVVGTLAGTAQFWYQNVFLPDQLAPVVNIGSALAETEPGVVKVTITLHNPTPDEVVLVASHYDVVSYRRPYSAAGDRRFGYGVAGRDRPFGREQRLVRGDVLRSGEVTAPGIRLAPGGTVSRELVVRTPRPHAAAVLNIRLFTVDQRLVLDVGPPRVNAREEVVQRQLEIFEESLWRLLTRGDRVIYTIETLAAGSKAMPCWEIDRLGAYVARPGRAVDFGRNTYPPCREQEPLYDYYYGLSYEEATSELALHESP